MIFLTFFSWIILSIIVGSIGSNRKIGFAGAFFLSLILSPIIGLIITVVSKSKSDIKYQEQILKTQRQQKESLAKISNQKTFSNIPDELKKIKELLDNGAINQIEFDKMKSSLIASMDNSIASVSSVNAKSTADIDDGDEYTSPEIKIQNKTSKNSIIFSYDTYDIEFVDDVKGTIYNKSSKNEYYFKSNGIYYYYDNYSNCVNALHYYLTHQELLKNGFLYRDV